MWHFIRRASGLYVLGFLATFIVTLFIMFDPGEVVVAIAIGAVGGAIITLGILFLERRFPDDSPPTVA